MNNTSNIIKIEDIENASGKTLKIDFEDFIPEISLKRPLKANLTITSLGEFIQVTGNATSTAILQCDLCLEDFEYGINIEIDEMFAKNALMEEYEQEFELSENQFVTDLKGADSLDITDLLYQSVILDFPNKKVCGINCKGGDIFIRDENESQAEIDPRMAIFKQIKVNGKEK